MFPRTLAPVLLERSRHYPVVFLTGPRQSGKTTLARATFPDFEFVSLEELSTRQMVRDDPQGFLRHLATQPGAILDEVQNVPTLFSSIQVHVDEGRGGPLILTGSQQFLLSERISQSLAGRAAILELLPLSMAELTRRPAQSPQAFLADPAEFRSTSPSELEGTLFSGLFPRIHDRRLDPAPWLDGYVRTYVERDVRQLAGVGDLDAFTRFLGLCAGRVGGLLNLSSLGSDAGISHVTAKKWVSILRASYVLDLVQPHSQNFSKRMIKSPRLHFLDTGLLCYLLGIRHETDLKNHPLRGGIFESFVHAELKKRFLHHGERAPIFFWRDSHGHEVDLLLDMGTSRIPIEVKSGETIYPEAFRGLDRYLELSGDAGGILVFGGHQGSRYRKHLVVPWWSVS